MFLSRSSWVSVIGLVLMAAMLGGCGDESGGAGPPLPGVPYGSPAPASNDPAVTAAAERLDPILRRDFPRTYSGLVLNHQARILVVYRKPDPALDAQARREISEPSMEFRDARFSLQEMQGLTAKVMGDSSYWSQRGVTVNGAGPEADGSGIAVMTSTGSAGDREKFAERYSTDKGAFRMTKGDVSPPIGQPWTPPPSALPSASST